MGFLQKGQSEWAAEHSAQVWCPQLNTIPLGWSMHSEQVVASSAARSFSASTASRRLRSEAALAMRASRTPCQDLLRMCSSLQILSKHPVQVGVSKRILPLSTLCRTWRAYGMWVQAGKHMKGTSLYRLAHIMLKLEQGLRQD